jgi:hypothetical protein
LDRTSHGPEETTSPRSATGARVRLWRTEGDARYRRDSAHHRCHVSLLSSQVEKPPIRIRRPNGARPRVTLFVGHELVPARGKMGDSWPFLVASWVMHDMAAQRRKIHPCHDFPPLISLARMIASAISRIVLRRFVIFHARQAAVGLVPPRLQPMREYAG